jgi:hypothetical protein
MSTDTQDPRSQNIKREHGETKGRYSYREEGKPEAELTYSISNAHLIIIDHTGVPEAYRGESVGKLLWQKSVEDARAEGVKILPLCPFAAAMFRRYPEAQDVLK